MENNDDIRNMVHEMLNEICPKCSGLMDEINAMPMELLRGSDADYLADAALEIGQMLRLSTEYSYSFFLLLMGTYGKGYRKGRAATPLTLVVAPESEGL